MSNLYKNIDAKVLPILVEMSLNGINVDLLNIKELSKIVKKDRLRLSITGPKQEIIDCLKKVTMIESVLYEDPFYLVEFPLGREPQTEIVSKIVENNWQLKTMEKVDTSLEDVFIQLTSNERKEM